MKVPITFVQDDAPPSTFDWWMGKIINLFAAVGMVATAGVVGYFVGR